DRLLPAVDRSGGPRRAAREQRRGERGDRHVSGVDHLFPPSGMRDTKSTMDTNSLIGFTAGCLTTAAFIPQVAKIWQTKSAKDVSLHAFATFTIGIALWLAYGIALQEMPIIVSNAITLVLAGAIL